MEPHTCRICLEEKFTLPRCTPCGHIYCYPCLLSMVLANGEDLIKCPECQHVCLIAELKPIKVHRVVSPAQKDRISFILLHCLSNGTVSTTRQYSIHSDDIPNQEWGELLLRFNKWSVVTNDFVKEYLLKELNQLQRFIAGLRDIDRRLRSSLSDDAAKMTYNLLEVRLNLFLIDSLFV